MTTADEKMRDKWKLVDADCRDGDNGIITYHVVAFDEAWQASAAQYSERIKELEQQLQARAWRHIDTAPKDGTLLLLWVQFESHPTEDAFAAVTIGANNFKYDGHDEWLFAGWNWEHDCFTQGVGTPLLWMPLPPSPELKGE